VVMDLTMPNMSGQEAFSRIRAIDPNARVLFASGHAEGELLPEELRSANGFLRKPYTPSTLGHAVRRALKDAVTSPSP
jgi:DNA-binding NarL/FixJ family response regulator